MLRYLQLIFFTINVAFSQKIEFGYLSKFNLKKEQPFWFKSNRNGIDPNGSLVNLKYSTIDKNLQFKIDFWSSLASEHIYITDAFLSYKKNNFLFTIGSKSMDNDQLKLSTGSLIESSNALSIPKITLELSKSSPE